MRTDFETGGAFGSFPEQLSASLHNRAIELRIDYTVAQLPSAYACRIGRVWREKLQRSAHVQCHV
jgi:hypothetical protein